MTEICHPGAALDGSRDNRYLLVEILPKNGIGAEFGVWEGDFSAKLLQEAVPKQLYLIDPWIARDDALHQKSWYGSRKRPDMEGIYRRVLERFAAERESGRVIVKRASSHEALEEFSDQFFDYVYIDGDHEYAAVRKDCFLAYQKVRIGGYICGDDYTLGGWWKDGVVRAFHELIHDRPVLIKLVRGRQIVIQRLS